MSNAVRTHKSLLKNSFLSIDCKIITTVKVFRNMPNALAIDEATPTTQNPTLSCILFSSSVRFHLPHEKFFVKMSLVSSVIIISSLGNGINRISTFELFLSSSLTLTTRLSQRSQCLETQEMLLT